VGVFSGFFGARGIRLLLVVRDRSLADVNVRRRAHLRQFCLTNLTREPRFWRRSMRELLRIKLRSRDADDSRAGVPSILRAIAAPGAMKSA
jgi:hypothetical protein